MNDKILYSRLKNKLSSYQLHPIINETLDVLYENDIRGDLLPFWYGITLIRWSILNCSSSSLILLKKVDRRGIISILKAVSQIEDAYHKQEMEKEEVDVFIQLHATANQQNSFQREVDKFTFPRQSLLYNQIRIRKSQINEQLKTVTLLNSEELLASLAFLHWISHPEIYKISSPYKGRVDQLFLNTISSVYGKEKLESLIKLLALDTSNVDELRNETRLMSSIKNPIFYLLDMDMIASKPIVKISEQLRIIHRKLLNLTSRYLIYDNLKSKYKELFTSEFGLRIEQYIKTGLDELKLEYKTEKQLKRQFPKISKVVDFLVEDKVMIECKGIELHPMPRVSPTSKNLSNYLKSSIVKALSMQFVSFANAVNLDKNECYAIIVTYKELNLGFGKNIIERILNDEEIQQSVKKSLDSERIFILELEEWYILLSAIKREKLSLTQVLDKVRLEEQKNRKAYVSMHLQKLFGKNPTKLDYLDDEYEAMMEKIKKSL